MLLWLIFGYIGTYLLYECLLGIYGTDEIKLNSIQLLALILLPTAGFVLFVLMLIKEKDVIKLFKELK